MTIKEYNACIDRIIKLFTRTNQKVLNKFLEMMVRGILQAKSIRLADIARALETTSLTTTRHIFKRLDRNLGQWNLDAIKQKAQAKQCSLIDDETLIIFDPSDVIKPYGKRFEAMAQVADGSDDHKPKPGYPVNVCIAIKGDEVIPLEWQPYSSASEEFISENDELLRTIDTVTHLSHRRGIFVLDRGFDRFAIIRHLQQSTVSFIIRMKMLRHFRPITANGLLPNMPRQEVFKRARPKKTQAWLDIRVKKRLTKRRFSIQAVPVRLSQNIDSPRQLVLVKAASKGIMTLYLLTNLENITRESMVTVVESYLARWKIEEFIRFVKQSYKAEGFRVRDLGRIKNLHTILFLAVIVLSRVMDQKSKFSESRSILETHARRAFPIPQKMKFFFYMFADGLAHLLEKITKPLLNLWSVRQSRQLLLPLAGLS
jgi:hypothetical protein